MSKTKKFECTCHRKKSVEATTPVAFGFLLALGHSKDCAKRIAQETSAALTTNKGKTQ